MIPEDHLEFLDAIWTRQTPFTYCFLGLNILVFILMALAGGSMNEPTLMAFGVKANEEIARGQWWRFVTPIFIHIGIMHLAFNSYALWIVGPQVEKLYGSVRFVILYLLTGIAGVFGSYIYHPHSISAGASGAIFGLFGVLVAFGIRYGNVIPPFFKSAVGTSVLPVIVGNLVIGFMIPGIDNSAHVGGLLAGGALGALIPFQRPGTQTKPVFRSAQLVLLWLVAVCFYSTARVYDGPHLSFKNATRSVTHLFSSNAIAEDFRTAFNDAQAVFAQSVAEIGLRRMDRLVFLRSATAKSIDELRAAPSLSSDSDKLMAALLRVMQEQYALLEDIQRSGTITLGHARRLNENTVAFERVMVQFSKWAETEGKRYGIQMGKQR